MNKKHYTQLYTVRLAVLMFENNNVIQHKQSLQPVSEELIEFSADGIDDFIKKLLMMTAKK